MFADFPARNLQSLLVERILQGMGTPKGSFEFEMICVFLRNPLRCCCPDREHDEIVVSLDEQLDEPYVHRQPTATINELHQPFDSSMLTHSKLTLLRTSVRLEIQEVYSDDFVPISSRR